MLDSQSAADLFIDILFQRVYQGTYHYMTMDLLPAGLPGRADDPSEMEIWYHNLDDNQKGHVQEIVKIMIQETICSILAILDNRVGSPIKGQKSEFAIYIQTYKSTEDVSKNIWDELVRFNLSNTLGYDELENLFLGRLRDQE